MGEPPGRGPWRVHVHLEYQPATLQWEVDERLVDGGGRVVDEDVNRAGKCVRSLGDDAEPVLRIGEVGGDHSNPAAEAPEPLLRLVQRATQGGVTIRGSGGDRHIGTFRREPLCDRSPDAATGSRHDGASLGEALLTHRVWTVAGSLGVSTRMGAERVTVARTRATGCPPGYRPRMAPTAPRR